MTPCVLFVKLWQEEVDRMSGEEVRTANEVLLEVNAFRARVRADEVLNTWVEGRVDLHSDEMFSDGKVHEVTGCWTSNLPMCGHRFPNRRTVFRCSILYNRIMFVFTCASSYNFY